MDPRLQGSQLLAYNLFALVVEDRSQDPRAYKTNQHQNQRQLQNKYARQPESQCPVKPDLAKPL
jgi:hypothetical protein